MDDRDFVAAFESCALPSEGFHHRDHVRLAWLYLKELPPAQALTRFTEGLQRFAEAHGKPGLYHETITWAYLLLIRERMARAAGDIAGMDGSFEELAAAQRRCPCLAYRLLTCPGVGVCRSPPGREREKGVPHEVS